MDLIAPAIERYVMDSMPLEDPLLAELAAYTRKHTNLPQMMTGHVEGSLLRILARAIQARTVLEIGTFTGYASLSLAYGLPDDGRVITCDVSEEWTDIAKSFWRRSPHGGKIELRLGAALDTVRALEGPFDLVFIDADKENCRAYWEACVPKLRSGALIAVDNVLWDGRVLDPREASDKAIVAFNAHAQQDERVDLVMLSVRDGITLGVKRILAEKNT